MKFQRDFPILLSFYPRLSASNALHLLIKGKLSEIYIRCIFKEKRLQLKYLMSLKHYMYIGICLKLLFYCVIFYCYDFNERCNHDVNTSRFCAF